MTEERRDIFRGACLGTIAVGLAVIFQEIGWLQRDESWLVATWIGLFASSLIPSAGNSRFSGLGFNMLMVLGAYVVGFKVSRLFAEFVDYPVAATICFLVYFLCWAILIKKIRDRRVLNANKEKIDTQRPNCINGALSLILVSLLAYSGIACNVARKSYQEGHLKSREASLELLLKQLREVIKQYELDNGHPPKQLNDMVTSGYINEIPNDPITGKTDWVVVINKCPQLSANCTEGVKDLHSASKEKSTRGNPYFDW